MPTAAEALAIGVELGCPPRSHTGARHDSSPRHQTLGFIPQKQIRTHFNFTVWSIICLLCSSCAATPSPWGVNCDLGPAVFYCACHLDELAVNLVRVGTPSSLSTGPREPVFAKPPPPRRAPRRSCRSPAPPSFALGLSAAMSGQQALALWLKIRAQACIFDGVRPVRVRPNLVTTPVPIKGE
ncbi:hypothetical protein LshimejAT787_0705680 [Lyophyllum shimeji]|uniref:Uncharacterized protein n=1 Tax=Lyophyllum shimeji TaxID=47721 RepID=A0A9P3UNV3_LYOSH|nr:hypothetical protein LshimejAT787_0705680 [Lyophyllum shimeji]